MEVWDVVDVAKKRVKIEGLKTSESGQELAPGLDAEFLDVYQVIFGLSLQCNFDQRNLTPLVESVIGHFQWIGLRLVFKLFKLGCLD